LPGEVDKKPMKAELVPENGDPPIRIERDLTLLGRHEDCDVVIDHPSLSKRHCLLVKTDGLLVLRDLATTNGTKVKGQRVRWAALLPEDRVSFGAIKMRIYLGSDEMPSPSEVRQGRSRGPGSRSPAASVQDRGLPRYSSSGNTELSPVSPVPRGVPQSFPEPSLDGSDPSWDSTYAQRMAQEPASAEPALKKGGFEIVEDDADAAGQGGGVFEGGFELVGDDEDDDDIIELD
jgi:predicted component of type VI protein secretion system